jgi:hypothetical protein
MERPNAPMGRHPSRAASVLEFRPWMLALAVFLACALGVTVMEQFREGRALWAQVSAQDAPAAR